MKAVHMNKIILLGGGGHSKVVIDTLRAIGKFEIVGIIDPQLKKGSQIEGVEVVGEDAELQKFYQKGVSYAFITVGSTGCAETRVRLVKFAQEIGFRFPVVIHPSAIVASSAQIEGGAFLAARCVVQPQVKIGSHAIVNTGACIDHDCVIGNFVHIAPGAVLSGNVKAGDRAHIGANSVVKEGVTIGTDSLIGVGSVVVKNIPPNVTVFGNPCRIQK